MKKEKTFKYFHLILLPFLALGLAACGNDADDSAKKGDEAAVESSTASGSMDKAEEGTEATTEGEMAPAEGEAAAPAEGEMAPAEGEAAAPAEGEMAPAEGEMAPAEGEAAPASSN